MTSYSILKTKSLGELLLTASEEHLTGVYFADCRHSPAIGSEWKEDMKNPVLASAAGQLQAFLDGSLRTFSLPLRAAGTDFQREIWRQIARIPFGQAISYAELAKRAGAPLAIRAAGTATGRNPLSIIVPCHRVIGANGQLHGYAGGLSRKAALLDLESEDGLRHFARRVEQTIAPSRPPE